MCADPGSPPCQPQCQMQITQADSSGVNPAASKPLSPPPHSFPSPRRLPQKAHGHKEHECAVNVTVMCEIAAARNLRYATVRSLSITTPSPREQLSHPAAQQSRSRPLGSSREDYFNVRPREVPHRPKVKLGSNSTTGLSSRPLN